MQTIKRFIRTTSLQIWWHSDPIFLIFCLIFPPSFFHFQSVVWPGMKCIRNTHLWQIQCQNVWWKCIRVSILHLFSRSGNHILNIFKGFSGEKWLHPFLMTKPNVLLCSPQFMHILAMRTVKLVAPKCARVTDTRWFNVKYNFFSTSYTVFKFQVPLQYFWRNQASCSGEILCGNKWKCTQKDFSFVFFGHSFVYLKMSGQPRNLSFEV